MIDKIIDEMLNYDKCVEDRLNITMLDSLIGREMRNAGINIDYEFAVRNQDGQICSEIGEFH
jgi:hypothetical protein